MLRLAEVYPRFEPLLPDELREQSALNRLLLAEAQEAEGMGEEAD